MIFPPALTILLLTLSHPCHATYDYLIVGGGTSGLLLSTLLTDNPATTVAVLEAGPDGRSDTRITIPENEGMAIGTVYDWNFTSTPQPSAGYAAIAYPRGRVLGGSSALNFMISDRASAVEFDAWSGVLNVTDGGWDWDAMYAAFKAVENFTAPGAALQAAGLEVNAGDHGYSGPIAQTMSRNVFSLWSDYVVPVLESLGVAKLVDGDGGVTAGVRYAPLAANASSYTRSYPGTASTNVEDRPNFPSPEGLAVASAVEYIHSATGYLTTLNASTIILSAGAIQSPPLLEASGIGDPSLLAALDIPVIVDLPAVGTNFQDHLAYAGSFSFNTTLTLTGSHYIQSLEDDAPPSRFLSAADHALATAWLFAEDTTITGASLTSVAMLRALWVTDEPVVGFSWFLGFLTGYALHPLSSGSVHHSPSSSSLHIDPNFKGARVNNGTVAWDLWLLAKALQYYATTVAGADPLVAVGATYSVPGDLPFEAFQTEIAAGLSSGSHPTGGCAMLPTGKGGVVDGELRVFGTANVRVVDLSVVATSPGQHTMGLAYATAARAADILEGGL